MDVFRVFRDILRGIDEVALSEIKLAIRGSNELPWKIIWTKFQPLPWLVIDLDMIYSFRLIYFALFCETVGRESQGYCSQSITRLRIYSDAFIGTTIF